MNKILENNIVLNKDTHEYRLLSEPELTFTSVTTFVDSFFEGFDSLKIATNLVQNHPRYAGCTVESLIAKWDEARDHGTLVHDEIENWIKNDVEPQSIKAIQGKNWLQNYQMKSDIDVSSELIVYSTELKIAGTFDILAKDNNTGQYELIDWKTTKKIDTVSYGYRMGTDNATKDVMDCNFYHYALQLSLYRFLLEEYYGVMIHNQLIAHVQDEGVNAIVAPYMKDEIVAMLAARKD
tara:strand:- start:261 stop:971 length:711 start_codon:yes stop_codon:yes gene_type:complete